MKILLNKTFANLRIQYKMALVISVLFIFLFVVQSLIYLVFQTDIVRARANGYILQSLSQTSGKIDTYVELVGFVSKSIIANSGIQGILAAHAQDESMPLTYEERDIINEELSKITLAYENINSIQIYTPGFSLSYNFASDNETYLNFLTPEERSVLDNSSGELLLISFHKEYVDKISNVQADVFSAVRKFTDFTTGQDLGFLFININKNALKAIIGSAHIGQSGEVMIINRDGHIVAARDDSVIGTPADSKLLDKLRNHETEGYYIADGNDDVVIFHLSDQTGWGTVAQLPMAEVMSEYKDLERVTLVVFFIGILLAIPASYFASKGLTRPLKELVNTMERIQSGDITAKAPVKSRDEIGHMGLVFNQMTTELHALVEQYYKAELSKKEAELKALQAQVNPHFLYNALDTIYWMLVVGEESGSGAPVSDFVISLSHILRYSIEKGPDIVSIGQDLQMLEHYLAIQKARFVNKINWDIHVSPELYRLGIPKMLIQPLVENAINHAPDPQKAALTILISAEVMQDTLTICVRDNGRGIDSDQLEHILENQGGQPDSQHTGLGLDVVSKRISMLFGEPYRLSLNSKLHFGTEVTLILPIIQNYEDDSDYENSAR